MIGMMTTVLRKAGWAPLGVVLFHATAAQVFGHNARLDPLMHFLGGAAAAYFVDHFLKVFRPYFGTAVTWARYLQVFCFAATVAVLWEFAEFAAGDLIGAYSQLSLRETMGDLFLGCFGAAVAIAATAVSHLLRSEKSW